MNYALVLAAAALVPASGPARVSGATVSEPLLAATAAQAAVYHRLKYPSNAVTLYPPQVQRVHAGHYVVRGIVLVTGPAWGWSVRGYSVSVQPVRGRWQATGITFDEP